MSNAIDSLERALETKLLRQLYSNDTPDCCVDCGAELSSNRQLQGHDTCGYCSQSELDR